MVHESAETDDDPVLDAAYALITDEGAQGWSLDDLAARAGVSREVVEAEFDSELQVFTRVICRDESRFEKAFEWQEGKSAAERIVSVFEATVPDFNWVFWIELWSLALRDENARSLCHELDARFRSLIEEIVRDGVTAGEFEVRDTRRVAVTIATLIDTMATNATLGDSTVLPNYMLDACVGVAGKLLGTDLPMPARADPDD